MHTEFGPGEMPSGPPLFTICKGNCAQPPLASLLHACCSCSTGISYVWTIPCTGALQMRAYVHPGQRPQMLQV
eukprot:1165621-Rhodomonas_salina.2